MTLTVTPELIQLGARFGSRDEAIESAIRLLIDNGAVAPEYLDDVRAREAVTSCYLGNHVAIPHGLDPTRSHILTSTISLVQVPDGVRFDDEDAYLVIGIAGKNDEHLELMGQLASVLVDEDNVQALRAASTVDEITAILSGATR